MKSIKKYVPVAYDLTEQKDSRYLKMRVKMMHTGLNLNGSNFDLDAVNRAEASCKNIPLLAFIKKQDGAEGSDFGGHEYEFKVTKNGMEMVYLGRPVGIIPETNNYLVEVDEDGKNFVYVDAYLWTDYANEALEIIQRDGKKRVSMEIVVDDYKWHDAGYYDIVDYRYTGIALLGDDVQEAMVGASAMVTDFAKQNEMVSFMAEMKSNLEAFLHEEQQQENSKEATEGTGEEFKATEDEGEKEAETENFEGESKEGEAGGEGENFQSDSEPQVIWPALFEQHGIEVYDAEQNLKPLAEIFEQVAIVLEKFSAQVDNSQQTNDASEAFSQMEVENSQLKERVTSLESQLEVFLQKEESARVAELETKIEQLFENFEDVAADEQFAEIKQETEQNKLKQDFSLEYVELRLLALRGKQKTPTASFLPNSFSLLGKNRETGVEPQWAYLVKQYREGNSNG